MNKKQERQKKIITCVERRQQTSMIDVLNYLDIDIDRKTLQRDLSELEKKLLIVKKGAGRGVMYHLPSNYKILKEIDVDKYFKTTYELRNVDVNFNFDIFELLKKSVFTNEERAHLQKLHDKFIKNFSNYDSQTLINKEFERIMIEFSWKSAAIEGNTYSLLSTEALLKENVVEEGKTQGETQMILNHKDVFNEVIQNKQRFIKLNYSDIEYIHKVLTKNLGITANIRNNIVAIIGTKYKPLDNNYQIKEALLKMTDLINQKDCFIEKAFLAVVLESYIQPFEDGNKRTARMLSNAILLANNSIPLSYRAVDIKEYKKAMLLFYEQNNVSYFKKIFIEQFEFAVNEYFL